MPNAFDGLIKGQKFSPLPRPSTLLQPLAPFSDGVHNPQLRPATSAKFPSFIPFDPKDSCVGQSSDVDSTLVHSLMSPKNPDLDQKAPGAIQSGEEAISGTDQKQHHFEPEKQN
jgi:hypothetical protein